MSYLLGLTFSILIAFVSANLSDICSHGDFYVFLTINSEFKNFYSTSYSRRIELNWKAPANRTSSDWVGLFNNDKISVDISNPLVNIKVTNRNYGYFKSNYILPVDAVKRNSKLEDGCLRNYWIGYIQNGKVIKTNCINVRPRWMKNNARVIGNISIADLVVPGTHNSGSYESIKGDILSLNRFSICQSESIWNQLVYGIRYFDIRVSYKPNSHEKFWIVHNFIQMIPLSTVVEDIKEFLKHTNEIVFLDFQKFHSFDGNIHRKLQSYLNSKLGFLMAPSMLSKRVKLNHLWKEKKPLILCYADYGRPLHYWNRVYHVWGDKNRATDLMNFISKQVKRRENEDRYVWATMATLTPKWTDVFFGAAGGLPRMSHSIANKITSALRDQWWNTTSVIATDFFLGNNVIEESIKATKRRQICLKH